MRPELEVVRKIIARFNNEGIITDSAKLFRKEVYTDEKKGAIKFLNSADSYGYYAIYYVSSEYMALITLLAEQLAIDPPKVGTLVGVSVTAWQNYSGMDDYRRKYEKELIIAANKGIADCVETINQIFGVAKTFCM